MHHVHWKGKQPVIYNVQWNVSWETTAMMSWKDHTFLAEDLHFTRTEPVTRDHLILTDQIFVANGVVFQDRFYCTHVLSSIILWVHVSYIQGRIYTYANDALAYRNICVFPSLVCVFKKKVNAMYYKTTGYRTSNAGESPSFTRPQNAAAGCYLSHYCLPPPPIPPHSTPTSTHTHWPSMTGKSGISSWPWTRQSTLCHTHYPPLHPSYFGHCG